MHFLSANWGIFLALSVVFGAIGMGLQLRNIKQIGQFGVRLLDESQDSTVLGSGLSSFGSVFRRFGLVVLFMFGAALCFFFTIVGVIANLAGR